MIRGPAVIKDTATRFGALMEEKEHEMTAQQLRTINSYRDAVMNNYDRAIAELQRYLAMRVVYVDMKHDFLGGLCVLIP